jgi:hypothetical protein
MLYIPYLTLRKESPLHWLSVAKPLVSEASQPSARARMKGTVGPWNSS